MDTSAPSDDHERSGWYKLPAELRLIIYSLTWAPRRVLVRRKPRRPNVQLRVYSIPPVTLHLNSDSRRMTLESYIAFFRGASFTAYINPALDTLELDFPLNPRGNPADAQTVALLRPIILVARRVTYAGESQHDWQAIQGALLGGADVQDGGGPLTVDFCHEHDVQDRESAVLWERLCRVPGCEVAAWADEHPPPWSGWRRHFFIHVPRGPGGTTDVAFPFKRCGEVPGRTVSTERQFFET